MRLLYKKGRPKGGVKEMYYRVEVKIEEREKAIEKMKEEAGCFVLVNNVPKEGEDGYITSEILKAYNLNIARKGSKVISGF